MSAKSISNLKLRSRFALLAFLAILCVAACWAGLDSSWRPTHALTVAEKDLSIGDVWEQEKFPWKFDIRNNTKQAIEIEDFSTSCGCVSIEPRSLTIPANDQARVKLILNLTFNSDEISRAFQVHLLPSISAKSNKLMRSASEQPRFTISGRMHRVLAIRPKAITFFRTKMFQGQEFLPEVVIADSIIPLDSLTVNCPTSSASVEVARTTDDPRRFELKVTPRRELPVGPFRFDLQLEPAHKDIRYPAIRLPVEGRIFADVQAVPDMLVLGNRRLGETVVESVTLRSVSATPFDIVKIESESDGTTIEQTTLPGIQDKAFRVINKIKNTGAQESFARFTLRSPNGTKTTIVMKVTYFGT